MPKLHFFTQADNQLPPTQKQPKEPKPKTQKYRLTNWPEYNKALINRGFVTLWLDENTLAHWHFQGPRKPGGFVRYSDQCVQAALAIKAVFQLAFRQTQGLIQSLLDCLKMPLKAPSYTQICRRQTRLTAFSAPAPPSDSAPQPLHIVIDSTGLKVYGEGEWKVRQHGADKRRTWRKLHLVADEATNQLHAVGLTTNAVSDAEMVKPLLTAIVYPVAKLGADGAYDQLKVYDELAARQITPVIPPRANAVIWTDEVGHALAHARNDILSRIGAVGLADWKQESSYHRRSKAETAMFRWKTIFGERLSARLLTNQQVEAQIKATCLNRFTTLGMPKAVKRTPT